MRHSKGALLCLLASAALATPPPFTVDVGNQYVTDSGTGLQWQKTPPNTANNWLTAINYCKTLSLGGTLAGRPWRLPTVKELFTIYDETRTATPWIDTTFFDLPVNGAVNGLPFWSNTPDNTGVWMVDFNNGQLALGERTQGLTLFARCVR
jgi:hypothetical protein